MGFKPKEAWEVCCVWPFTACGKANSNFGAPLPRGCGMAENSVIGSLGVFGARHEQRHQKPGSSSAYSDTLAAV